MTTPCTGSISFSQIQSEFGGTNPVTLSEYYRTAGYIGSGVSGIPSTGALSASYYYCKTQAVSTSDVATIYVGPGYTSLTGSCAPQRFNVRYLNGQIQYQMYNNFTNWVTWTGSATGNSTNSYATCWRNEGEAFRITQMNIGTSKIWGYVDIWDASVGYRWQNIYWEVPLPYQAGLWESSTPGTYTVGPITATSITWSAAAGGGGGGGAGPGVSGTGGGAGASLINQPLAVAYGSYLTVTIGAGGAGGRGDGYNAPPAIGGNGAATTITGIITLNGGAGGNNNGVVGVGAAPNGGNGNIYEVVAWGGGRGGVNQFQGIYTNQFGTQWQIPYLNGSLGVGNGGDGAANPNGGIGGIGGGGGGGMAYDVNGGFNDQARGGAGGSGYVKIVW